jgi:hypothetical protein
MPIDDWPPLQPDPVIEAYKKDVDRTLIRENLKRTPAERVRRMVAALEFCEELRAAARRGPVNVPKDAL